MKKKLQRILCFLLLMMGLTGCDKEQTLLEDQYKEKYIQDMEVVLEAGENVVYTGMVAGSEQMFWLVREQNGADILWKVRICDISDGDVTSTVRLLKSALFEEGREPEDMIVDEAGTIYMRFYEEEKYVWKLLSPEDVITRAMSEVTEADVALTTIADGGVGLLHFYWQSGAPLDSANVADLYTLDKQGQEKLLLSGEAGALFMTMQDEEWLVYANGEGVYKKSMVSGEKNLLYLWSLHGISFPEIRGMQVDESGRVGILMEKDEKLTYIRLSPPEVAGEPVPTPKLDAEPVQITFLGNPYTDYRELIVEFQKQYPQYTVMKVSYPDEARLLTELMAGKGPVLIDTYNIDFKENIEYWECMDEELEENSLKEGLLEKVQLAGQIEGKQYGMVSSWQLFTFATMYQDVENWNYEEFIDYIKSKPQLESIYSEQSPAYFIERYFFRDLNNCPFINAKEKQVDIDTPQFRELLELTERLARPLDEPIRGEENTEKVILGTRLGLDLYILQPSTLAWDLDEFRGMNIIGFPGANGSEHYINGGYPVVIRETASIKEKEAAFAFLEFLLSYEGQRIILEGECEISVRKDVLEEQLQEQPTAPIVEDGWQVGYEEPEVSKEEWNAEFMKIYEKLQPYYTFPKELADIIEEELNAYFNHNRALEETTSILQNRVQLWLDENL